jgi:SAM-dependent methyltransferase
MSSRDDETAVRGMYEAYPFPNREDFASMGPVLVEGLRRWGVTTDGEWLDLGTGTGEIIASAGPLVPEMQIVGIDFSEASLEAARQNIRRAGAPNVRVEWGDIRDPRWRDGSRDVVTAMGSIHHLEDPTVGLATASGALKVGGLSIFYFYARHGRYLRTLQQRLLRLLYPEAGAFRERVASAKAIFAPENWSGGGPMEDHIVADEFAHPCEHTYTIGEVESLLESNGLRFLEWMSMPQDPAAVFSAPEVVNRCRELPPPVLREVFDLWFRREAHVVIARKG